MVSSVGFCTETTAWRGILKIEENHYPRSATTFNFTTPTVCYSRKNLHKNLLYFALSSVILKLFITYIKRFHNKYSLCTLGVARYFSNTIQPSKLLFSQFWNCAQQSVNKSKAYPIKQVRNYFHLKLESRRNFTHDINLISEELIGFKM